MHRKDLFFSNSKQVDSKDVKFSLERHIISPQSQSQAFYKVVQFIEILSTIKLKKPFVPVLLALSRDQLGILPKNWKFDLNSIEPFIGTGPYRILSENNKWVLIKNLKYRKLSEINIKKWNLDLFDPHQNILPSPSTDLIVLLPKQTKDLLQKKFNLFSNERSEHSKISFFQTSFWWLNRSFNFYSLNQRLCIQKSLKQLSSNIANNLKSKIASGVIPNGILGTLPERPAYDVCSLRKNIKGNFK
ncbi:MAG: ABC transporter substrate-binding protein [Bdellovibrionaceae bacterium]|nr:ABC transporter substrate-binding protein [Pseudobdellovibrionaceae bacterium]